MKDAQQNNPSKEPATFKVFHARVDSVILYEIKENELDILEKGSQADIFLNFAIFLLSIAISCLLSLCTAKFDNDIIATVFVCLTIIGFIGGVLLLILWWRGKSTIKSVIKSIRDRVPAESNFNRSCTEIEINNKVDVSTDMRPRS